MKNIPKMLLFGLIEPAMFGLMVFLAAFTVHYWQAWVFLGVFAISSWTAGIYLLRTDPVALQRRMRGGPAAETRKVQKLVMAGWWLSLATTVVVSGLDHRFGWSAVPTAVCLVGDVLVAAGFCVATLVVIQNGHAAATVRVEETQQVVTTGLYGLVRHPMYTGNLIMMAGIPLALGSYWGLVLLIPGVLVLASRIRDEEQLLAQDLVGYREYTGKVRYRLVPYMW
ncbi:isoprenylcysteine carboxylmethyltransferase family protein [Mycobacterium sp. 94-17]|uniref:methyltransferase family protein n=1 Tax=Mycobacterium sp. 94-17 TaxID=2986147 RepID=UPI002D1F5D93|nr:isoprenylcysteine carboxylmethyltransferase family protein [Mycobacterium sp. 94-17]MEB4212036.1 isoprenylcysteine carboxylmethyltransferase family protein [Mycobacterium sp. 94-17]